MMASLASSLSVADRKYKTAKRRLCASPAQSETSALGCHGEKPGVVTATLLKDRVQSGHCRKEITEDQLTMIKDCKRRSQNQRSSAKEETWHMAKCGRTER
jgi:hypothetical protein